MLLPIRIETLFFEGLRVRIYPDVAHVDSHEPALTETEIASGLAYWADVAAAGADPARQEAAWAPLADRFGPERAAWVARATRLGRPAGTPRPAAWARAPLARLLPTRWHVAGFNFHGYQPVCVFDVAGAPIPPDLAVGPDPATGPAPAPVPADGTFVDPGMQWMVDYAAAEAVGMAVTIPNPREVDRLLVYGVDETATPEQGQARLAALLEAHYYTDGFGFVEPGTPTNNTTAERSGLVPLSAALRERYRLGDGTATRRPPHPAGTVAADLATALGLADGADGADGVLARDPAGARVDHQAAMNAVVWPSSWGYFLLHILEGISLDGVRKARRHFIDYVRADGPLPTVRLGAQPYGVLPVMVPWGQPAQTADIAQHHIHRLTGILGVTWLAAANNLPDPLTGRPRPPAGDAGPPGDPVLQPLLRTLALQPKSAAYAGRSVVGPEYISSLWRFLRLDLDDSWRDLPFGSANVTLSELGVPGRRHAGAVFAEEAFAVPGQLVGTDPGAYITEILGRTPTALRDAPEHGSTPLLYRILRDAALRELWTGLLIVDGGSRRYVEDELVDLDDTVSPTLWRGLQQPAPPEHGGPAVTIGQYLDQAARASQDPGDPNVADLREFRACAGRLATLPAAELDRLMRGSLDLAAHRLDAWTTSLAGRRLAELRAAGRHPTGILVGGYGWVTGLKWQGPTPHPETPPGERQPLYQAPGNAGYVHAPSLRHATTAAILHAAYIARGGPAGSAGPVAVDLSAERVQLVARLLDGVQAGQSLDSVLGYRFERALAEGGVAGVPYLVETFRLLAPCRVQTLSADGDAVETSETGAVTDGLALFRRWREGGVPWGSPPDPVNRPDAVLPAEGTDEYELCVTALQGLADMVDALADAALAEGVHHLAAGNAVRGGAVLDAFTKADAPPPDLDVVRTPRSGAVHTHRLMFLGSVNAAADVPVWPTDGRQVRAGIEPTLNGWAAALLGDPGRVRCRGVWRAPDGSVRAWAEVTLADVRLSPLDLVCLAGGDRSDRLYELRQRFVDRLRLHRPAGVPEQPMPEPDFGRQAGWPSDVLSVLEVMSMAAAVRAALLAARPVRGEDLAAAGDALPIQWNVAGMRARTFAARAGLATKRQALHTAVLAQDIGPMGAGLVSLASHGIPGAMPEVGRDWTDAWRAELVAQGTAVIAEADRRLAADDALQAGFDAASATPYAQVQHEAERLRTLLGEDFPVAPTWTVPPAAAPRLTDLLSHGAELLGGDRVATGIWLDRLARVRAGARRLHEVLAQAEATDAPAADRPLTIAQSPYVAGERWVALPPAGPGRQADRTALAVHTVREVSPAGEVTGLVFDEWTEMVPDATETTGVTFHYDAPSARPPQALLVAVPPTATTGWSPQTLRETVSSALDLAQIRTMDLPAVGELGHFLPAIYFALNQTPSTVSTDLTGAGT
ncbi:hypothetical protein SAMN04489712_12143 [Thermomonospora echinospora]|uniref:Uncharacterized protein n=1 Tax=Thermomonospora echinospora TaxID=1992 RepID=A0A1H6DRP5_9ACTN|nr:hypothetical protein SAMN04489712_12143 [Thermomonospora echinospora]